MQTRLYWLVSCARCVRAAILYGGADLSTSDSVAARAAIYAQGCRCGKYGTARFDPIDLATLEGLGEAEREALAWAVQLVLARPPDMMNAQPVVVAVLRVGSYINEEPDHG